MSSYYTKYALIFLGGFLASVLPGFGQTNTLTLASGTTTRGGTISLPLTFASGGPAVAGLQWTFRYATTDIVSISAQAGSAATAAGKKLLCSGSAGSYLCLLTGVNSNVLSSGVVANVTVTLSSAVTTTTSIGIRDTSGVTPGGKAISVSATGAHITVSGTPLSISSVSCNPSSIVTPSSSTCTVTLNYATPSAVAVSLTDNSSYVSVPASITVGAGASNGQFSAVAVSVASSQTAVITAKLGASSQSGSLVLAPPAAISSLQCTPMSLTFGATSSCIVAMNRVVPQNTSVAVSTTNTRALTVPSVVTVPAQTQTGAFGIRAGSVPGTFGLAAAVGGSTQSIAITVTGGQQVTKKSVQPGENGAAQVDSLVCSPRTVKAGEKLVCQLFLASASGTAAQTVPVSSSSVDIEVPPAVATRSKQSSLSFEAYTNAVARQQSVTVTAGVGERLAMDTVILVPPSGPAILVPGKQTVAANSVLTFHVQGMEASGALATVTASRLPSHATFDQASGTFYWVPEINQIGAARVTFRATDSKHESTTANVEIEIDSGRPIVTSVVNGASMSAGSGCSPNAIASLLGSDLVLANTPSSDPSGQSVELGGARVRVNGYSVPVLYASRSRIDFVCPQLASGTPLDIKLEGDETVQTSGTTVSSNPGVFSVDEAGQGQGVIRFVGSSDLATVRNPRILGQPAQPGDDIAIRATGVPTSAAVFVKVGGVRIPASAIEVVQGGAGVEDILLTLPAGAPTGDAVPISLELTDSGGLILESNVVTMAIEGIQP